MDTVPLTVEKEQNRNDLVQRLKQGTISITEAKELRNLLDYYLTTKHFSSCLQCFQCVQDRTACHYHYLYAGKLSCMCIPFLSLSLLPLF